MKKKINILTIILLVIDLITKYLIDINFDLMESKVLIPNFFNITKIYNTGASWNILDGYRIILIIITLIVMLILISYQKKIKKNNRNILAFSLLYSGIIGNLIDRIIKGYVIDFLDFKIFGYDYPVFNFADICIVIGTFLLIIAIIKKEDVNEVSSR